jgi:hypothetical protein
MHQAAQQSGQQAAGDDAQAQGGGADDVVDAEIVDEGDAQQGGASS